MKTTTFLLMMGLIITQSSQSANLSIVDPQTSYRYNGYIDDVELVVSPIGSQAQIELTFSIYVDSLTKQYYWSSLPTYLKNMLELQMNFDLPANAYVYDSYLWLDKTTIIRANIIDRNSAINIYEGIVKRRRDPSILIKNNSINYAFNVYPVSTVFPRKVKIVYTVPFEFNTLNSEMIQLPNSILQNTRTDAMVKIKINNSTDCTFANTIFPLKYNSKNTTAQYTEIEVKDGYFKKQNTSFIELNNTNTSPMIFNYYPQDSNRGYYEIKIHGSMLNKLTSNTKVFNSFLPFKGNGIVYDRYNLSSNNLIYNEDFIEAGVYEGVLNLSDSVTFIYSVDQKFYQIKAPISTNTNFIYKSNWINSYCVNNSTSIEAKILSLLNRVLTTNNAFLALETGDTVNSSVNNVSNSGGGSGTGGSGGTGGGFGGGITMDINNLAEEISSVSISPNPFLDNFIIKCKNTIEKVEIYQSNGSLIYQKDIEEDEKIVEVSMESNLPSGLYFVVVYSKGEIFHQKITKQ